jgi:hypothetical protein
MKNVRFFVEYPDVRAKRKSGKGTGTNHSGNVLATFPDNTFRSIDSGWCIEAVGAVYNHPNSAVASTSVAIEYIRNQCKRISESVARRIHPNLMDYMDAENE